MAGEEEEVRPYDDVASARIEAVDHGEALELQLRHCLDHVVMQIRRLEGLDRTGFAATVRRIRHVDREGPGPFRRLDAGPLERRVAAVDDDIAVPMAHQVGDPSRVRRTLAWPLPPVRRSVSHEVLRVHPPGHHPVPTLVDVGCHDEHRRDGRQERQRMESKGGDPDVGHDRQDDSPPQLRLRRRQGSGDEDPAHEHGNREQPGQVQCPYTDNDQHRQNQVAATTQPAGRDAVTHDAADIDTVGGANEPVLLAHGL